MHLNDMPDPVELIMNDVLDGCQKAVERFVPKMFADAFCKAGEAQLADLPDGANPEAVLAVRATIDLMKAQVAFVEACYNATLPIKQAFGDIEETPWIDPSAPDFTA